MPAGKAMRGEGIGARQIAERCWQAGGQAARVGSGGSRACKEAKTQCKHPACHPASAQHSCAVLPTLLPASPGPARSGTGDH